MWRSGGVGSSAADLTLFIYFLPCCPKVSTDFKLRVGIAVGGSAECSQLVELFW